MRVPPSFLKRLSGCSALSNKTIGGWKRGFTMGFGSILDQIEIVKSEAATPAFVIDLNLDQVIGKISAVWGEDVQKFYEYFPPTKEAAQYRRDVYADIERNGLFDAMNRSYSLMMRSIATGRSKEKTKQSVQKRVWHIHETALYCDAVSTLAEAMEGKTFESEGMSALASEMEAYYHSDGFISLKETALSLRRELDAAKTRITYTGSRMSLKVIEPDEQKEDDGEKNGESLRDILYSLRPDNDAVIKVPFGAETDLRGVERELMGFFVKHNPEIFKTAENFYDAHGEYREAWIMKFYSEVAFYLSFMSFEHEMSAHGAQFAIPTEDEDRRIEAKGLYDLALFIANTERHEKVVSNDFYYDKGELFFVLTGPNQGGKTTFARSLGQLIFFGKMGLKVAAGSANLHYFSTLITHFSVEESVETGRGKLMEELVRLSPMMKDRRSNSFVVINELFTTAANYDAAIMGKKVLSHFIGKGCHGIYVTHLTELLEAEEHAVGLCAQLDDNGVQTFKILRSIMEYSNVAASQIDKFGLSYEQLKERLAGRFLERTADAEKV